MTTEPGAFHPVVVLPAGYDVLDLTVPASQRRAPTSRFWVGKWDERRPFDYGQPLFGGRRELHVGVDLGGPEGTAVHSFAPSVVEHAGYNAAAGDYGHVLVVRVAVEGAPLWALYGHLSAESVRRSPVGSRWETGDVLGWLGGPSENGGWPPHLHFQLSVDRPETHDLPGVVSLTDRVDALRRYPDPRRVLGPLW